MMLRLRAVFFLFLAFTVAAQAGTLRVHYDVGYGHSIFIRGSIAPLSWTKGVKATWTTGNVWVWSYPSTQAAFSFKPLKDDTAWSTGANYAVPGGNAVVDIYPFFGPSVGKFQKIARFHSPEFNNDRDILVYLPPSYSENKAKRYPVLYMHDGQNLFNASTAFGGVEWQVDETFNRLIGEGTVSEALVVGLYNTANRIAEYTPTVDPQYGGGSGNLYLDFIQNEVKPYIDTNFRTLTTPDSTLIMGSSLGGLISCYGAYTRPTVFGEAGCMSSSFWWNNQLFTTQVEAHQGKVPIKIYLDSGGQNDGAAETNRMRDALAADGYIYNVDLWHWYDPNGSHNEASWAARLPIPLQALLPFQKAQITTYFAPASSVEQ